MVNMVCKNSCNIEVNAAENYRSHRNPCWRRGKQRVFPGLWDTERLLQCGDWGGTNLLLIMQRPERATEYHSTGNRACACGLDCEDWDINDQVPEDQSKKSVQDKVHWLPGLVINYGCAYFTTIYQFSTRGRTVQEENAYLPVAPKLITVALKEW